MNKRLRVAAAARSASAREAAAKLLAGIEEIEVVPDVGGAASDGAPRDAVLYLLGPGESPDTVALAPPLLFVADDPPLSRSRPEGSGGHLGGEVSFVRTTCSSRELSAALSAVAAGLLVRHPGSVPPPPAGRPPTAGGNPEAMPRGDWGSRDDDRLTARERQVLVMIAEGLPNKTIAAELGITSHTVKFHIASIMQKLGAQSRTEAVTVGLRKGIIFL